MKLDNWNINTAQVNLWLAKEDRPVNPAIELSVMLGNDAENDDERDTYWGAIRNLGKKYSDFPMARRGRESDLPEEVILNATSVKNTVIDAFAGISNADVVLSVILPHGRSGGSYATINDLAEDMGAKAYRALITAHNDKDGSRWDGSMDGLVPTMTPPPVKAKAEKGGEEEE